MRRFSTFPFGGFSQSQNNKCPFMCTFKDQLIVLNTVKLVYNDHPRDQEKVVVVQR
jgi:hypothetical protein